MGLKSTAKMLFSFMAGISDAPKNISPTDRAFITQSIFLNNDIVSMRRSLERIEVERNNTYIINTQVSELSPNLDANTLIKPDTKSALKVRINNLLELLKQGITLDTNFTELDKIAIQLKDRLLTSLKAYFSKKTTEKSALEERQTIAKTVEERTKETDRLVRSFNTLYPQITRNYDETRGALPGTLNLKPLNALPTARTENQPSQLRHE